MSIKALGWFFLILNLLFFLVGIYAWWGWFPTAFNGFAVFVLVETLHFDYEMEHPN